MWISSWGNIGVVRHMMSKGFMAKALTVRELLLYRFYSTFFWTYLDFSFSPHIPYWFCFGPKFTTRYNCAIQLFVCNGQNCQFLYRVWSVGWVPITCIWNLDSDQYASRCILECDHTCYQHLLLQLSPWLDLTWAFFPGSQARSLPTDGLRPAFLITNAAIYVLQVIHLWRLCWH
jgi:hypothetical protein